MSSGSRATPYWDLAITSIYFRAKDIETASKVSTLVRTFGHAHTEIWTATEWDRFKEIVRAL